VPLRAFFPSIALQLLTTEATACCKRTTGKNDMPTNVSVFWGLVGIVAGLLILGGGFYFLRLGLAPSAGPNLVEFGKFSLAVAAPIIALCALTVSIWQLTVSRDSSERQIRAYVGFFEGGMRLGNGGAAIEVQAKLKNFGNSPASDFTTWIVARVLPKDDLSVFGPRDPSLGKGATSILYPDGVVEMGTTFQISPQDLAEVRAGSKKIFVWGGATYKDVFGNDRFSNFYDVNSNERGVNSGLWGFQPAKRGYEAN